MLVFIITSLTWIHALFGYQMKKNILIWEVVNFFLMIALGGKKFKSLDGHKEKTPVPKPLPGDNMVGQYRI